MHDGNLELKANQPE